MGRELEKVCQPVRIVLYTVFFLEDGGVGSCGVPFCFPWKGIVVSLAAHFHPSNPLPYSIGPSILWFFYLQGQPWPVDTLRTPSSRIKNVNCLSKA